MITPGKMFRIARALRIVNAAIGCRGILIRDLPRHLGVSENDARAALFLCRAQDWIEFFRGGLIATERGRDAIDAANRDPYLFSSWSAWKDEALTGITTTGARSEITRGVLPTRTQHNTKPPEPHIIVIDAARSLDIRPEQMLDAILSGRVIRCVYHGGYGYASYQRGSKMCRDCHNKRRKERRNKHDAESTATA